MSPHPQSARPATFRFGEFTFDCESHLLLHRGIERHLSPKAQQLLQLLLEAQPRPLSRQELYDALWPSTFVCETNLASVIKEVRGVLGDDARTPEYIRTIHRFGYGFRSGIVSSEPIAFAIASLRCEGQSHRLGQGDNMVGRALEGHIVITEPTISRHHAIITVSRDAFLIQDLDSKNGTYVDGQRIGRLPTNILPNAEIKFGATPASISLRSASATMSLKLNLPELRRKIDERMITR